MLNQSIGASRQGQSSGLKGMAQDEDVVHFVITRREVEGWQVQEVVLKLNELSATSKSTRRYQDALVVKFSGYDSDRRQLHQIPEVVRFFWAVFAQWPYFFHFLHKTADAFRPVMLLLVTQEVATENGMTLETAGDKERMTAVFNHLFEGMNGLYRTHGFPDSLNRTMTGKVTDALNRVLA
jgi:hypothetical protein